MLSAAASGLVPGRRLLAVVDDVEAYRRLAAAVKRVERLLRPDDGDTDGRRHSELLDEMADVAPLQPLRAAVRRDRAHAASVRSQL